MIMSGWKDDNPDNERRETTRDNLNECIAAERTEASCAGDGSERMAMLPGQGPSRKAGAKGMVHTVTVDGSVRNSG